MDKPKEITPSYVLMDGNSVPLILEGLQFLQQDCLHSAGNELQKATGYEGDKERIDMAEQLVNRAKRVWDLGNQVAELERKHISHPEVDKLGDFLRKRFPDSIQGGKSIADNAISLLTEYLESMSLMP